MASSSKKPHRVEDKAKQSLLDPFWSRVLSWDWFKDVIDDRAEASATSTEEMLSHAMRLHGNISEEVPAQFDDVESYINSMEPLLFQECRMQLARCKSEVTKSEKMVAIDNKTRRTFLDGMFMGIELERDPANVKNCRYLTDDLVLLSTDPDPKKSSLHRLCYVDSSAHRSLNLTWHVAKVDGQISQDVAAMARALKDSSTEWYVSTINSMSTVHREYRALHNMKRDEKFPLRKMILSSKNPDEDALEIQDQQMDIPEKLMKSLKDKYNESQFLAMKEIFQKPFGITLVQGPPGTGKTTTIMGIASALLHAKPKETIVNPHEEAKRLKDEAAEKNLLLKKAKPLKKVSQEPPMPRLLPKKSRKSLLPDYTPWYDQTDDLVITSPVDAENSFKMSHSKELQKELIDMSVKEVARKIPQKVLICAPSNAAIDEIVRRLVSGITGPDGNKYKPSVVRLGPNVAEDLRQYSLNDMVDKKIIERGQRHDNPSELKMRVLQDSRIVCCTLSVAGAKDLLEYPDGFDVVVVDEAAQAIEVSNLIPLQMGCKRLVLIGDPLQLPATVFAQISQEKKYNRSLFERLQSNGHSFNMLATQYRMHPTISYYPSKTFYNSELLDAGNIMQLVGSNQVNKWWAMPTFLPLMFFNVKGCMYSTHKSWKNNSEVEFICSLIFWLKKFFPNENFDQRIGVISPYQSQVRAIRKHLNSTIYHFESSKDIPIKCATVDGFQGSEKDIIIVSTVRSGFTKGIGFVDDKRRMNVSLTRPRLNLWVVGDANKLCMNSLQWKGFVQNCSNKHGLLHVTDRNTPKVKLEQFSPDGDSDIRTFVPKYLRAHFRKHEDRYKPENELFEKLDDKSLDSNIHLDSIGLHQVNFNLEEGAEIPIQAKSFSIDWATFDELKFLVDTFELAEDVEFNDKNGNLIKLREGDFFVNKFGEKVVKRDDLGIPDVFVKKGGKAKKKVKDDGNNSADPKTDDSKSKDSKNNVESSGEKLKSKIAKVSIDDSDSSPPSSDDESVGGVSAPDERGRFNSDGEWEPVSDSETPEASDVETRQKKVSDSFFDLTEEEQLRLAQEAQDASKLLAGQTHLADTEIVGADLPGVEEGVEEEERTDKKLRAEAGASSSEASWRKRARK
eukprot:gene666-481_t